MYIKNSTAGLGEINLQDYGAVVVCDWSAYKESYTAGEAALLADYVRQGGSLLILAEKPEPSLRSAKIVAQEIFCADRSRTGHQNGHQL